MMDGNHDNPLEQLARAVEEDGPNFHTDLKPATHRGQRPTIWVALVLFVISVLGGVTAFAALYWARTHRDLGEEVPHQAVCPWNRLDKAVAAVTVETGPQGQSNRLLAADAQTFHCGTRVKDLYYWQRKAVKTLDPGLSDPSIVGLSAHAGRLAIVYEQRDDSRRGIELASLPEDLDRMALWSRPAVDTSYFPGVDDETASSLVWDDSTGRRLVGGPGVGIYDPSHRCWDEVLTQSEGDIGSERVNDLEMAGGGILAVAGTGGIDLGHWSSRGWAKTQHVDGESGLVGDNVRTIHTTESDAASNTADLAYLTNDRGLGRLRVNLGDGGADQMRALIGEGSAAGLSRQSLLRFGQDDAHDALWMIYRDPQDTGKLRAGLYQTAGHQMTGSAAADSWPRSDDLTLGVDTYTEECTAWVGGNGLHRIRAASAKSLEVIDAGLHDSTVQEIVPAAPAIFVKAKPKTANSPACVYMAQRENVGRHTNPWKYSIGPRRFPGLELGDITAATDGTFEGQPALFVGTRDKGIGAFVRNSREMVRAFAVDAGAGQEAPVDGSLDLDASGPRLVQVGSDRSLHFYNGSVWSTVIPGGGIQIDPKGITTAVSQGSHLVVGSEQSIGHYDATTHRWTAIEPIPGLQRLIIAIDRLWAIDNKQALYSCALAQAVTDTRRADSSSGVATPPPADGPPGKGIWTQEELSVVDVYGDSHRVVVIAEDGPSYRLWVKTLGDTEKRTIVEATALLGDQRAWTAAAVDGTVLYVAPHGPDTNRYGLSAHGPEVGRYDLATHQWTSIPLPPGAGAVGNLAVTRGGLWLLDTGNVLFCRPQDSSDWVRATDGVTRINAGHGTVVAVKANGNILMSDPFSGAVPMRTLVGDGFADTLANVKAGAVFKGRLFVATPARTGRYDAQEHSWHTYEPNVATSIVEFAASAAYLYGRSGTGQLWRWTDEGDAWEIVRTASGESMRVRQVTGTQGSVVVVLDADGRLQAISDGDKDRPVAILEASRCPVRGRLTAAVEAGQDLIVASGDGVVAAYGRRAGRPWSWNSIMEPGGSVEQLLACQGRSDKVVAVGNDKAVLLSRNSPEAGWQVTRTILEASGRIRGDISSSHFYGLVQKDGTDRWLLKADLPAAFEPSTEPPSVPMVLIGERFPASPSPGTAAVCTDERGTLYRADESGVVARYSFETHSWTTEPIQGVGQFLRLEDQLWAWCPSNMQLSRRLVDQWQKDDGNWVHVAGDGKSILLTDAKGQVVLRTTQGDRTIIPALSEDLPVKSAADIVALAEQGNTLFLTTANGPLVAYDRSTHKWQSFPGVTGVARFEKVGGTGGTIFAVTQTGGLLRFDATSQQWVASLPERRTARAAVSEGDRLAVITDEGHLLLLDARGQVAAEHRPGMIEDRDVVRFDIAAATERDGQLLLLPRSDTRGARLWAYDPQRHVWAIRELSGTADRFLPAKSGLWVATRQKSGTVTMSRIVTPQLQIGASVDGLLDVSSDGQTIVAVTADGRLRQLEADGKLTSLGVAETSLPDGRQIRELLGVANACVALLDDGSVYHYTMQDRKWSRQVPPCSSGESGTIIDIGDGRAMLLVQSRVDIWSCDLKTAVWTKLKPGDVVPLPGASSGRIPSDWEVTGQKPEYKLRARVGQRMLEMEMREGRLGFDRADRVAMQPGVLHMNTMAGVRTFKMQQGRWVEEEEIGTGFTYAKPDPVTFEGEVFAVRRQPEGAFQTADGRLAIAMKVGGATPQILPARGGRGLGFAHDVIRDVTTNGHKLLLATAGGAVGMTADGTSLRMDTIYEGGCGLTDPNLVRIVNDQGYLLARSNGGRCYASSNGGQKWDQVEWAQMEQVLARSSAISRYNEMLTHWRVRQGAGGTELDAVLGTVASPVSLSQRGFGFDRPRAFSVSDKGLCFYTLDGLATMARTGGDGSFGSLDPAWKLPSFAGFADVLEPPQSQGSRDTWLRATAPPYHAWSFDRQQWSTASADDYAQAIARLRPYFYEGADIKWDRKGLVTLGGRTPNVPEITVSFDAARGRFDTDTAYNLAVFENNLWAVTKGGVLRFNATGAWDYVTPATPGGLVPAEDWRVRVVPLGRGAKLVLQWPAGLLEWDGRQWGSPADPAAVKEAVTRLDAHLVYGNTWRIEKAQALVRPMSMQARLVADQPFVEVRLRNDGLFDFERVNSILGQQNACHVASEFGLYQIDPDKCDLSSLARQNAPAIMLGQIDGKAFARLESGAVLSHDGQWRPYDGKDDVFARIKRRLVQQSPWQLDGDGVQLQVQLRPGQGSPWSGPHILPAEVKGGRFDFDTVYDAGYADMPWLITEKGLLPRVGPDLRQIGKPEKITGVGSGATLSHLTYDDTPKLLLKTSSELYYFDTTWRSIPSTQRPEVERTLATQVAKGPLFEVRRASGQLDVRVRIGEPADRYKRVEFDGKKGLFTFDILRSVCPYAGDANDLTLIGTDGGVAAYDVRSVEGSTDNVTGAFRYLYCDAVSDGLEPARVSTVAYARRNRVNFAVNGPERLYQLKGFDGGRSFGKWELTDETGRSTFEYTRNVISDDPDAWQVTARGWSTAGTNPFDMRWRRQIVRLIDLENTRDAVQSVCRFAHDVPLSASLADGTLWVGTRGGVAVFAWDDPNRIDPTKFDIRSEQTLPAGELTGIAPAQGIGFVRAGDGDRLIYARRASDNTVLCCDVKSAGGQWRQVPADNRGFLSACAVAEDPIWSWEKDSLKPVRLRPRRERVHVPVNYPYLTNGTWMFLEVNHAAIREPRRTMAFFHDQLYIGTAGGITRFSLADATGGGAAHDMRLDVDIYAIAGATTGLMPLLDVTSLYVDRREDRLYAQARNGCCYVFDPAKDTWSLWDKKDSPMDRAMVLVDNDLFHWRMMDKGEPQLNVAPLDLTDQSAYPLFQNGRFVFDDVHEFLVEGDRFWMATDGGVCLYSYREFRPIKFFAQTILAVGPTPRPALPAVHEVIRDRDKPSRILCKTADAEVYVWEDNSWKHGRDDGAFEKAYCRQIDPVMKWYEYPQRGLQVRATAGGQLVTLGAKGGGTKSNLFRNGRFSFDDVRDAVLDGSVLLTATPIGVVEQTVDWNKQQVPIRGLYCYASHGTASQEMFDLERITKFPKGPVLVWGIGAFTGIRGQGAPSTWTWQPYEQPRERIGPEMVVDDGIEQWKLVASEGGRPVEAIRLRDGRTRAVASRFKCRDVSQAVADDRWIYVPVPEPKGGLLRICKNEIVLQ